MDLWIFVLWQAILVGTGLLVAYREATDEGPTPGREEEGGGGEPPAWAVLLTAYGVLVYVTTQFVALPTPALGSPLLWLALDYAMLTAMFSESLWWRRQVLRFVRRFGVE